MKNGLVVSGADTKHLIDYNDVSLVFIWLEGSALCAFNVKVAVRINEVVIGVATPDNPALIFLNYKSDTLTVLLVALILRLCQLGQRPSGIESFVAIIVPDVL